jgi:hypothetical protein
MPQSEHICACGKSFILFRSYSAHIIKHKCNQNTSQTLPKTPQADTEIPQADSEIPNSGLLNVYTNSVTNHNQQLETTRINIVEIPTESIAYKSSHTNQNPKVICEFCAKYYSKHHINTHKSRCKHKYKESYEYKLLVRAGIRDIPETYIEIRELFCKLIEDNPDIFTNLPRITNQSDELEFQGPRIGRPQKAKQSAQQIIIKNIIGTNNNITNNTSNNTNISNVQNINNNITQQNINVFINPVCHESIAHISPERQMYIILQRLHSFKALIDSVYENPANHNIYISDRKGEQVKYLDREHGVNNGEAGNIIGDVAMSHLGHLDNFIETHKNNIPEHRKGDLKFLEAQLIDEHNNPKVIKQLNAKVASLAGSSKILLDRYQKNKVIEYINALPELSNELDDFDFRPDGTSL